MCCNVLCREATDDTRSVSNVVYGVEIGKSSSDAAPPTAGHAAEKAKAASKAVNGDGQAAEVAQGARGEESASSTGPTDDEDRKQAQFQSLETVQKAGKTASTVAEQAAGERKSEAQVRQERHVIDGA